MPPIFIEGRRVYMVEGNKTQTVRVCTEANLRGTWEHQFRLEAPQRVTAAQVAERARIAELTDWLRSLGARDESSGSQRTGAAAPCVLPPPVFRPDPEWLGEAVRGVDAAIDALVMEFVDHPYLHRVEHSLHVRLCEILASQPIFRRYLPIGTSGWHTQPIHKEWPETVPRPHKDGRRGNFDLAILSPNQLAGASLLEFQSGRIAAGIVVEMGLDYGFNHLVDDHEKLLNSAVPAGYLVDFRRRSRPDLHTRDLVLAPASPIKTAYVHHAPGGGFMFKTVNDTELRFTR